MSMKEERNGKTGLKKEITKWANVASVCNGGPIKWKMHDVIVQCKSPKREIPVGVYLNYLPK